jgi:hypothetical protein
VGSDFPASLAVAPGCRLVSKLSGERITRMPEQDLETKVKAIIVDELGVDDTEV